VQVLNETSWGPQLFWMALESYHDVIGQQSQVHSCLPEKGEPREVVCSPSFLQRLTVNKHVPKRVPE
jgi:hypothetical protein